MDPESQGIIAECEALLEAERAAHGLEDPRYARALEDAAEVLLALGALPLAVDRASEAAGIYFEHKHERFAKAIALEAEIISKSTLEDPLFDAIGEVPSHVIEAIASATIERTGRLDPSEAMTLLRALYRLLLERAGESHPASVRVLAHQAALARGEERWRFLDALVGSFECINALPQAIEALIERAIDEAALGRADDAERSFAEATARARELNLPELEARALQAAAAVFPK